MTENGQPSTVSPVSAGLRGRCPRCGKGALFSGFLSLAPNCDNCGLDFSFADAADGPAVFITMIVGFLVVGMALIVEIAYRPPVWLHFAIWIPFLTILSLILLRPAKALLIAAQFHHKAAEGRLVEDPAQRDS